MRYNAFMMRRRRGVGMGFKAYVTLALAAVMVFSVGCTRETTVTRVTVTTPVPVETAEPAATSGLQSNTATPAQPETTPAAPAREPNGVAEPGDLLPQKRSYEENKRVNPDVIGWLTVPNTQIDYPVVRTSDNEFYLNHNVEREESAHGAVFMDYRNADSTQQKHLILYGHNMKNGTMFHDLNNYKQESFFEQNRIISFIWNNTQTKWEVYAAYVWEMGGPYFYLTRFGTDQNFADCMNDMLDYVKTIKYSVVDEDVVIKNSDQVLTLTTCTYEYDDSWFVVSARRIE